MKSLKEFDYDLWTTEEGTVKKYWVRVKRTGEVTEVSHEVMKLLRREEKRMHHELEVQRDRTKRPLRLNTVTIDDSGESWLKDPADMEEDVCTKCLTEDFRKTLTPKQRMFFDECLCNGLSQSEYARRHGISRACASRYGKFIRKKAKNFFQRG